MSGEPARGSALGAATRLLVLGAVRIFQPVHGYFVRRELASWDIGGWASIHPGSIYNALRGLSARGWLEEAEATAHGSRPARTAYRLTADGEAELFALLRAALRGTDDHTAFLVAINLAFLLPRAEVVDAVGEHLDGLQRRVRRAAENITEVLSSPETPDTATEVMRILVARTAGEVAWAEDYLARIRGGAYAFAGEEPTWFPTEEQIAAAVAAGAHVGLRLTHGPT